MRVRYLSCALCAMLAALSASRAVLAQNQTQATQQSTVEDARIPSAQLDSLVAPIALYPDPLLAQVLAASTYPLEIVQLQQWLAQNPSLKDQALVDAVSQQSWDPSVQSMAPLPDVVKLLASDIKWVTDLGNAFLAQQDDVMQAVQRMRQKANAGGKLKSTEHLTVENKTAGGENVIVIEQSDPQTIYVPSYNPTVVYGEPAAAYAYPAVAYPPVGYYAAGAALSFGVGVAMGAAFHGGWGYGCGWGGGGHNEINVNRQNNFQRNNVGAGAGGGKWQHNPQHRGGAPYGNRATNDRFGGSQRNARAGNTAGMDRGGAAGDRGGNRGGADRGGADRGGADRGGTNRGGADRGGGNRGGSDRVGNRSAGNRGGGGGSSALGSGNRSGGYNGQAARQSSNRGSASTSRGSGAARSGSSRSGGSRGGGASRGGGGRGGGGRGGGRR